MCHARSRLIDRQASHALQGEVERRLDHREAGHLQYVDYSDDKKDGGLTQVINFCADGIPGSPDAATLQTCQVLI